MQTHEQFDTRTAPPRESRMSTLRWISALLVAFAGDEARWRARPFVSMSSCFVVPPLRFAEDACRCLEAAVRGGMPVLLLAAGQAGATSPAALAGAVVQEVAEVLAGLVYVNALSPGHPAIFGSWPFVSDLRTGAMSGGSGEQAVLMAACAQMGRFYDLPTGIAAGMADSKLPDAQAGYEKGYTTVLAGHSGANLVYQSAGMLGSLLGACLESFVIDNDMLGAVNRSVRGVDIDDESLSVESMREVCMEGPKHFLGQGRPRATPRARAERSHETAVAGLRASMGVWGSGRLVDVERPRPNAPRVDMKQREPVPARKGGTGVDVPAIGDPLHLVHHEVPVHQGPKPRDRPAAVAANVIFGGIKTKQRDVDVVLGPRLEHRRRDGPVEMRKVSAPPPGCSRCARPLCSPHEGRTPPGRARRTRRGHRAGAVECAKAPAAQGRARELQPVQGGSACGGRAPRAVRNHLLPQASAAAARQSARSRHRGCDGKPGAGVRATRADAAMRDNGDE